MRQTEGVWTKWGALFAGSPARQSLGILERDPHDKTQMRIKRLIGGSGTDEAHNK